MINELWSAFPRLLVQKINALLDEAEPSPIKAFQLYKTCQYENLWHDTFEKFSKHLEAFFAIPKIDRRKSHLDRFLDRPLGAELYADFHLTFRNALVSNRSILDIASWAHHLCRVGYKTNSAVISEDVFTKTLNYITHPPHFEKERDIEFEDFCAAWKKTVSQMFGKTYDPEFNKILAEVYWLNSQLQEAEKAPQENGFFPTIYLTQTEIDWTLAVRKAVFENSEIPKFPLSRGPQKERLCDLERTINLYRIVQNSRLPEFIKHRDNIRATLLDRCDRLLHEKAA